MGPPLSLDFLLDFVVAVRFREVTLSDDFGAVELDDGGDSTLADRDVEATAAAIKIEECVREQLVRLVSLEGRIAAGGHPAYL